MRERQSAPGTIGKRVPGVIAALAALVAPGAALAHAFTAAILAVGEGREARLEAAVNGFLLAAGERDFHAAETADGHLGGVDVFLVALPAEAAARIGGLAGAPDGPPDFVVVIGPGDLAAEALAALPPGTTGLRPGALPPEAAWRDEAGAADFARRYRAATGEDPGAAAAEGYNAARRLDLAIRPHDGVAPRAAIAAALEASEAGIDW